MITNLLLALAFFVLSHALPAMPGVRQTLISRIGRPAYLFLYVLMSLVAFTWLIWAALTAPTWQIWEPVKLHFAAALGLMALSCVALVLGLATANPLSLSIRRAPDGTSLPTALSWTRHPLLWALILWSLAHILSNGDTTGLLLFGTLGTFSALYMPILDRRKRTALGEATWTALTARAPLVPLGKTSAPAMDSYALKALGLGLLLFGILLALHEPVIGISPVWIFSG